MPLTPEDVQNKRFTVVRFKTGYDEEEVDNFLDEVEEEVRRLIAANRAMSQTGLRPDAPSPTAVLPPEIAPVQLTAPIPAPPPEPVAPLPQMPERVLDDKGDPALRTLMIAQRTAEDAIAKAHSDADAILRAARVRVAAMEQEVRDAHASRLAALEQERTGLIEEIAQLRAFEREFRTRLRGYISSSMADLDARPGILPAPELPVPVVPPGTQPATGRHAVGRPTGELPTADPALTAARPPAAPAPQRPQQAAPRRSATEPAPPAAPSPASAPLRPAPPAAPPGFVSPPVVPPSGPPTQA
jgi:DivIVA domain-containing protein